jgi:predicted AAA+ superfamily ATPase
MDKIIKRSLELNKLKAYKDSDLIKVVTGIRRCGKSTLLKTFWKELVENGVSEDQVFHINFEDPKEYKGQDWRQVFNDLDAKFIPDCMNYVFLDEPQELPDFERLLDGLYIQKNVDLYVIGSNAKLLSSDLATLLTGRHIEIRLFPFSFAEFTEMQKLLGKDESPSKIFARYLEIGGLPGIFSIQDVTDNEAHEYANGVYQTILEKDIYRRHDIRSKRSFENIAKYILDHIGSETSPLRISNTLKSNKQSVDNETVEAYLSYLTESYVFSKASRFDIKGKAQLATLEKYYAADLAFRHTLLGRKPHSDTGHLLENVIYVELLRRGYDVWVGKIYNQQVDFVAKNESGDIEYFQVSESVKGAETYEREIAPFLKIRDNYPKTLLTTDDILKPENGFAHKNVYEWLLAKQ